MKTLIIEDDPNKISELTDFFSDNKFDVIVERSYNSGLRRIIAEWESLRLLILDMNIPTFDIGQNEAGGRRRMYGGKDILWQMSRRKIGVPAILVTMFDFFDDGTKQLTLAQVTKDLEGIPGVTFLGSVFYSPSSDDWKTELNTLIRKA